MGFTCAPGLGAECVKSTALGGLRREYVVMPWKMAVPVIADVIVASADATVNDIFNENTSKFSRSQMS